MPNISQNNEIEHINKKISLLQDRLKIKKKRLNQFQNALTKIRRIRVKQGQRANLSQTKKIPKIFKDIFKDKISISKKDWSTRKCTCTCKKRKRLFEKGLKKIAKMQNLSQDEFHQTVKMHTQPLDELEQIAKIRRIKDYEDMKKEDLIISLLK